MRNRGHLQFTLALQWILPVLLGCQTLHVNASVSSNASDDSSTSPTVILEPHSNKTASLHGRRRLLASMEPQSFGSNDIQVLNERDLDPQLASKLWDFPCPAYHDISRSASFVATSCTVSCEGDDALANEEVDFASPDACPVAMTACRAMIECTTVLIQANGASAALKGGGSSLQGMKHLDEDDSMRRLLVNTWWGTPQLPSHGQPRPRSYIVASFGGCGSKMLAGWLAMLPRQHTRTVFHLHDRHPPQALRGMRAPVVHRRPPPGGRKTPASRFFNDPNADMRTKNFGDDATFRTDTAVVPASKMDEYRVVFIYKDPVESLVSRFDHNHCTHVQGDCGDEANWPSLSQYAQEQRDRMRLQDHFNAYLHPDNQPLKRQVHRGSRGRTSSTGQARTYPVVAVNYHKMWHNLPALMAALGLPPHLAATFPKRIETVRGRNASSTTLGVGNGLSATRTALRQMYAPMVKEITANPAVLVV